MRTYLLFLACLAVLALLALLFALANFHRYTVALEYHKVASSLRYDVQIPRRSIGPDVRYGGVYDGGPERCGQYPWQVADSRYKRQ